LLTPREEMPAGTDSAIELAAADRDADARKAS
jgi:hypothetical protein